MPRSPQLYEVCPACGGSGTLQGPIVVRRRDGSIEEYADYPCPSCEPLRVVPIGVTTGQLDRPAAAELQTGKRSSR